MEGHTAHATHGTAGQSAYSHFSRPPPDPVTIDFRHIAVVGSKGHVATFDWQAGTLHAELQLRETCRDITLVPSSASRWIICDPCSRFLQDHSHFAVAQNKYVFIYDRDGVELHKLKSHIEPTRLEFLPYHWLLVSVVRIHRLLT